MADMGYTGKHQDSKEPTRDQIRDFLTDYPGEMDLDAGGNVVEIRIFKGTDRFKKVFTGYGAVVKTVTWTAWTKF